MKRLDWEWRLPDGVVIRARLELPARVETVWVGPRITSKSEGGKVEGHVVPLAPAAAGAYRGGSEGRIAFDTFDGRLASCVLTIDGQVIPPDRAPRTIRPFTLPTVGGGILIALAFLVVRGARLYASRPPMPDVPPFVPPPPAPEPEPEPVPPPAGGGSRTSNDHVVALLRPAFKRCYQTALNEDPATSGRLVVIATIGPTGIVEATQTENQGLPPVLERCLVGVVKEAQFSAAPASLRIPISFVQQR